MNLQKQTYLLAAILLFSCSRDDVNPADYADDGAIRPNEFLLKAETYILTEEDKQNIVGINDEGILVQKEAAFLTDVRVGSVIVNTASDPGDSIAYFRKVTEIQSFANNIGLRTVDVPLHEAYSRYIIDSRSSEFIFTRTNIFPVMVECKPPVLMGWVGLTLGTVPNIEGSISFDIDSTYFTAQYDSAGTIPFKMDMQLKDLRFNLSGDILFKGKIAVGPTIDITAGPLPVLPIAETGLTVYVNPKANFKLKAGGEIKSPQFTITSGPHNFSFSYDESNNGDPVTYNIDPMIVPTVLETKDWSAKGGGSAEVQVGTDVFIGITGAPKIAKAGFFAYGYTSANASQKGNFTDLQPRVSFDADLGIGAKIFAELGFLADEKKFNPTDDWLSITGKLESPDFKFEITKWHLNSIETCKKYNSVIMFTDDFQNTNEIILSVECPGCTGTGYKVWVNDAEIEGGTSFPYNQTSFISLPPNLELLNSITIEDNKSTGCHLSDVFLDPSLFNTNCTQFVDTRDGNSYCSVQIGTQTWMGENLRYDGGGSIGHWYLNEAVADTLLFGRLYTFSEVLAGEDANTTTSNRIVRGICPQGWHLPSLNEWNTLIAFHNGVNNAGRKLKINSSAVWPNSDLQAGGLFNAVSAGEYYPWFENSFNSTISGNRFVKTNFWTNSRGMFPNGSSAPNIVEITQEDLIIVGTATQDQGAFGSIEQIGYSCRCVKN